MCMKRCSLGKNTPKRELRCTLGTTDGSGRWIGGCENRLIFDKRRLALSPKVAIESRHPEKLWKFAHGREPRIDQRGITIIPTAQPVPHDANRQNEESERKEKQRPGGEKSEQNNGGWN